MDEVWICQISQEISQKRTRERMSDQEAKELKNESSTTPPTISQNHQMSILISQKKHKPNHHLSKPSEPSTAPRAATIGKQGAVDAAIAGIKRHVGTSHYGCIGFDLTNKVYKKPLHGA
ncbi:hypothetical protein Tco_0367476, partial [Tanacetum coccineum]